jgi:hypothetical protein
LAKDLASKVSYHNFAKSGSIFKFFLHDTYLFCKQKEQPLSAASKGVVVSLSRV